MNSPLVVKRYAKAMLQIAKERDTLETTREQLDALGALFDASRPFRNVMLNPSVRLDDRKAIMRATAEKYELDPMVRNFTLLLLDKDRFRYIRELAAEFGRLVDVQAGLVRASLTSAVELQDGEVEEIREALAELTNRKVELELSVDPALIGGVVTRIGGVILDGSVRTQLDKLRQSILSEI